MSDAVARLNAALSGRYAIEREIGAGGMATVWLAEDLRHRRRVALKVLKPELAAVLGAERFVHEITTTASLQHPHILPLFDSGEADGFLYYVMPFVDGETLRERLNRETQLGVEEAARIAGDVADALEYAHRHNVIHRDIKPENILLHDGRPVVADFGIALAVSAAAGGRMTETGLSLGTPHYMSPEQATAEKELTGRSDVYSLAAVLYEMLTGSPPHVGASAQQIIVRIIADTPRPVSELRRSVPANVAAAVMKALEKLPADRFASAGEFRHALFDPHFAVAREPGTIGAGAAGGPTRARYWRDWRLVTGVPVLLALALAAGRLTVGRPDADGPPLRFRMAVEALTGVSIWPRLAISPDGRTIAYAGPGATRGREQLYLRRTDELEAKAIPGGEVSAAMAVSFSPDGSRIAYLAGGGVNTIPVSGGVPSRVAAGSRWDITLPLVWLDDATLVVTDSAGRLLRRGLDGSASIIASPDTAAGEVALLASAALPGGRLVLAIADHEPSRGRHGPVLAIDVTTGQRKVVTDQPTGGVWYHEGHLIRALPTGELEAAPFDARKLASRGPPTRLAEGVLQGASGGGAPHVSVSRTGSLVYAPEVSSRALVLVDRTGRREVIGAGRPFDGPRFSPDGRRLALRIAQFSHESFGDIWLLDLAQHTMSRVTFEGRARDPIWFADGRFVAHLHYRDETREYLFLRRRADGSGVPDTLHAMRGLVSLYSATRDGARAIVHHGGTQVGARGDIVIVSLGETPSEQRFTTTPFYERDASLSPDGRWLAYRSDESGQAEVYVQPFPDGGAKTLVSLQGGLEPVWGADGRELFYIAQHDGVTRLIAARIAPGPEFTVTARTPLFEVGDFARGTLAANYDIAPDGPRFVFVEQGSQSDLIFLGNWPALVRRASR